MGRPPDVSAVRQAYGLPYHNASPCRMRNPVTLISKEDSMTASPAVDDPIRVGVIADQTGALSFVGVANTNVARMVVGHMNAKGGLLGRHLELHIEDGGTDDAMAAAAARKMG